MNLLQTNIKLIAIDLDGTLLNSDGRVSPKNVSAVQRARHQGIMVVLVSARPPFGIMEAYKSLGLDGFMIAYNGAMVIDITFENILLDIRMAADDALTAIDVIRNNNLYTSYNAGMSWYVEKESEEMYWEQKALILWPKVATLTQSDLPRPHKFVVADLRNPERLESGYDEMQTRLPHLNVVRTSRWSFEVFDASVSKASTLALFTDWIQINKNDVMAIGDNYNDLDMLEFAGISVAMGNAPDEVRAVADQVVASNDNDGVAEAIEGLLMRETHV